MDAETATAVYSDSVWTRSSEAELFMGSLGYDLASHPQIVS